MQDLLALGMAVWATALLYIALSGEDNAVGRAVRVPQKVRSSFDGNRRPGSVHQFRCEVGGRASEHPLRDSRDAWSSDLRNRQGQL